MRVAHDEHICSFFLIHVSWRHMMVVTGDVSSAITSPTSVLSAHVSIEKYRHTWQFDIIRAITGIFYPLAHCAV